MRRACLPAIARLGEINPDPRAPVEPVVDLHQAVDGEAVERGRSFNRAVRVPENA